MIDEDEMAAGRECLDRHDSRHTCRGPVTGRPSNAGTGTIIYRCDAGHEVSAAFARRVRSDYPDSSTAPDWFDPTYAGERWDDDY